VRQGRAYAAERSGHAGAGYAPACRTFFVANLDEARRVRASQAREAVIYGSMDFSSDEQALSTPMRGGDLKFGRAREMGSFNRRKQMTAGALHVGTPA